MTSWTKGRVMSRNVRCLCAIAGLFALVTTGLAQAHDPPNDGHGTADNSDGAGHRHRQAENGRPDASAVAARVVELTNAFRAEHGRPKVRTDGKLQAAAQYFADYMARTGRYGHDADGKKPSDRARRHGYDYSLIL